MESQLQEWKSIFETSTNEELKQDTKNYDQIINDFLLPDKINLKLFQANLQFLDVGMKELYTGEHEPTESIYEFGFITHRPILYPLWFFAAYPDVILWLRDGTQTDHKIFFKASEVPEENFDDDSNFVNDKLNHEILHKLISYYKSHSGKKIETTFLPKNVETIIGNKLADSMLPDDFKVNILEGEALLLHHDRDYQGAINKYTNAIQIQRKDELFYQRGLVYYDMKLFDNAISDFNNAIQINSNFKQALIYRASIKFKILHDKPGALADLRRAADLGDLQAKEMYNKLSNSF